MFDLFVTVDDPGTSDPLAFLATGADIRSSGPAPAAPRGSEFDFICATLPGETIFDL